MNRRNFIQTLAFTTMGATMNLGALNILGQSKSTTPMPVLFVGHGNPMNAIEENPFVTSWRNIAKTVPTPSAILCISAHWETNGTLVTAMETPKTIHDFGGFPQALFDVQYPAPGSPELAKSTKEFITSMNVGLDNQWGLDHGTWSVLKHFYPLANIPIVQLSLNYKLTPIEHYNLAKEITELRSRGVLIVASGNMVHNLGVIDWRNPNGGYDWANEANQTFINLIEKQDHTSLINYNKLGKSVQMSIPSPEHFLPLLYILAQQQPNETVEFFNNQTVMGSLSMTSVVIR